MKMENCKKCNYKFHPFYLYDGFCIDCNTYNRKVKDFESACKEYTKYLLSKENNLK